MLASDPQGLKIIVHCLAWVLKPSRTRFYCSASRKAGSETEVSTQALVGGMLGIHTWEEKGSGEKGAGMGRGRSEPWCRLSGPLAALQLGDPSELQRSIGVRPS